MRGLRFIASVVLMLAMCTTLLAAAATLAELMNLNEPMGGAVSWLKAFTFLVLVFLGGSLLIAAMCLVEIVGGFSPGQLMAEEQAARGGGGASKVAPRVATARSLSAKKGSASRGRSE